MAAFAGEDPAVRRGPEGVDVLAQDREQLGRDRYAPGLGDGPVLESALIVRRGGVAPALVDFRP